jgi:outer membrane protein OmpA-like peptidoglycan-associated protein
MAMKKNLISVLLLSLAASMAHAGLMDDLKKPGGGGLEAQVADQAREKARAEGNKKVAAQVNKKLLAEGRKNQCTFKSGTAELEPGCGNKSKKLAGVIIDVKKTLQEQGQSGFKFIVSGHTDSSGNEAKNMELSARRAEVMVKELIAQGVDAGDIEAVGMGSKQRLVKPDNTPAKRAKNRRYEVQVRF